jgi:hypothetical protein
MLIADPTISQNSIAAYFGRTPTWISIVINSDAFQSYYAARKAEVVDPELVASIRERFQALTVRSLQVLQEKLTRPADQIPDNLALKAAELGAKGLGVGGNAPPPAPAQPCRVPSRDRRAPHAPCRVAPRSRSPTSTSSSNAARKGIAHVHPRPLRLPGRPVTALGQRVLRTRRAIPTALRRRRPRQDRRQRLRRPAARLAPVRSGMLHVAKAASGHAVRGVDGRHRRRPWRQHRAQSLPATKHTRRTLVLVNDNPQSAVGRPSRQHAAALGVMAGVYASFTRWPPRAWQRQLHPSWTPTSIGATVGDLLIAEVLRNDGANSLLRVAFVQHELAGTGRVAPNWCANPIIGVRGSDSADDDNGGDERRNAGPERGWRWCVSGRTGHLHADPIQRDQLSGGSCACQLDRPRHGRGHIQARRYGAP